MARLAVFASGRGSNFIALAAALKTAGRHAIEFLLCDVEGAAGGIFALSGSVTAFCSVSGASPAFTNCAGAVNGACAVSASAPINQSSGFITAFCSVSGAGSGFSAMLSAGGTLISVNTTGSLIAFTAAIGTSITRTMAAGF